MKDITHGQLQIRNEHTRPDFQVKIYLLRVSKTFFAGTSMVAKMVQHLTPLL